MKYLLAMIVGGSLLSANFSMAQCTINGATSPVCANSGIQTLSTTGTVMMGNGMTGNNFDPAVAGVGSHTISSYNTSDMFLYTINQAGTYAPVASVGTSVPLGDDQVSGALPVGFNFNFFGTLYNTFYISSNGFISFDPAVSQGCCSGGTIPAADAVNNVIAWDWNDLYPPGGGAITYETIGAAPYRRLLVTYTNLPHCCSGPAENTGQIILYETTNIIEIHTGNVTNDGSVNTQGIENAAGTVAYATPGRNATAWTATNDYVAFIPTMTYLVNQSLPYAPVASVGTSVSLSDDQVSGVLPVGFDFTFFGSTYSNFYLSSNGFISFDPAVSQGCCSGGIIPAADAVNNVIAWGWNDLYPPGGGSLSYETVGVAPNRRLLVTFTNLPHCCSGPAENTGQIILNETTNIIEIHSANVTNDGSVNTQGIENANGTIAYATPGRNATTWTATNDAVSFSPSTLCATTTIVVNPLLTGTNAATICTGDSYSFGVQTLTTGGTYTEVFSSVVSGCDSTVTLTLSENPALAVTNTAAICTGESYIFETQTLTTGGTYTEVFSSVVTGCDSTITLILTENPALTGTNAASICTGETFTFGTQTLTTGGTYTEVFSSVVTGCDSTVTLTLTENTPPTITLVSTTDELAGNDGSIDINVTGGSTYSYAWDNSEITQDITGLAGGVYNVTVTDNATGCEATESVTVDSQLGVAELKEGLFVIHPNPSNGIFNVTVAELEVDMKIVIINSLGQQVLNSSITEKTTQVDISNVSSGAYFVRVTSEKGNFIQVIIIE